MKAQAILTCLTFLSLPAANLLAQEPFPAPPAATVVHDGTVEKVLVNPHGDPDGLLLRDGTLVRFPPHSVVDSNQLRSDVVVHATGEPATTPNGVTLFDARVDCSGRTIVDPSRPPSPPPPPRRADDDLKPMAAKGRVRLLLTNPDGVVDGFLLDEGTIVHAGPRARLSRLGVVVNSPVAVTGVGGTYPQGQSLKALTLQLNNGPVYSVDVPPPAPPPAPARPNS